MFYFLFNSSGDEDEEGDNDAEMGADQDGEGAGNDQVDEKAEDEEESAETKELMKELKLDEYDDEPEGKPLLTSNFVRIAPLTLRLLRFADTPLFGGLKGLSYHTDNSQDPYITMEEERDEDDLDDLVIKDTDLLILVAKTEDDVSHLEVHIYEEEDDNLYVHHDVMLPAFPLCVEWVGHGGASGKPGNFAAVGTFQPEIEVWNVDVVDALYPHYIIGEQSAEEKKKAKVKQPKKSATHHTDAVLGLSWNKSHGYVIRTSLSLVVCELQYFLLFFNQKHPRQRFRRPDREAVGSGYPWLPAVL